jgi:hypothetical protein
MAVVETIKFGRLLRRRTPGLWSSKGASKFRARYVARGSALGPSGGANPCRGPCDERSRYKRDYRVESLSFPMSCT